MNIRKPCEPETTRRARMIEVIERVSVRGNGVDSVFREVTQYWNHEGKLLAEHDPCRKDISKQKVEGHQYNT